MRRYIRQAPPELLPEFFQVVREYAKIYKKYCPIDMDFFYWDADHGRNNRAHESLEGLKHGLERLKARKESELEFEG